MNRTVRTIIGIFLVGVIVVSGVVVSQNLARSLRLDVTEHKLYTLSDGTKAILDGLSQPVKARLYYTKEAAVDTNNDQIRFFNNYYEFVRELLEEYAGYTDKIQLEIIDPRPFSDEEIEAIRLGLKRFPLSEEDNFFFGLAVETPYGVTKTIDFFSPDRQNFVEYDISYLLETATTRQKQRVGILSPLPVMGDDMDGYMAQMMRMQGQEPKPAWGIVQHLKQKYEVSTIDPDVEEIKDVDLLLVIHPKDFAEKTLFAIDQYVLKGGRTVLFVDPHCVADQPNPMQQQMGQHQTASNPAVLLKAWGLEMPENTFAGDLNLAYVAPRARGGMDAAQTILPLMDLKDPSCFNRDKVITAQLNTIRVLFPGVLKEIDSANAANVERTPLITTTAAGNTWQVGSPFELMMPNFPEYLKRFRPGTSPVAMGYMVTGKLTSAFPEGIEIEEEAEDDPGSADADSDSEEPKEPTVRKLTGLTEAEGDCAVAVFSDVDLLTAAYQETIFGLAVMGDNSALVFNTIEDLSGSRHLISIRSRGSYRRPFTVVEEIERRAEADTREREQTLQDEIAMFEQQLNQKLASVQGGGADVIASTIMEEKRSIEEKIAKARQELMKIKKQKREDVEALQAKLQHFCMIPGPALILLIAVLVGLRRAVLRRYYVSHASDS